jgi:hypothetical protein
MLTGAVGDGQLDWKGSVKETMSKRVRVNPYSEPDAKRRSSG